MSKLGTREHSLPALFVLVVLLAVLGVATAFIAFPSSEETGSASPGGVGSDPWPVDIIYQDEHSQVTNRFLADSWSQWVFIERHANLGRHCEALWNGKYLNSTTPEEASPSNQQDCKGAVVRGHHSPDSGKTISPDPVLPRLGPEHQQPVSQANPDFGASARDFASKKGIAIDRLRVVSGETESGATRHSLVLAGSGIPVLHEWHENGETVRRWGVKSVSIGGDAAVNDAIPEEMKRDARNNRTRY